MRHKPSTPTDAKTNLKLTESVSVIRSLATLVCLGKLKTQNLIDAQLMQHDNNNGHKEISKRIGPDLGYRYVDIVDYVTPINLFGPSGLYH